VFAFAGFFRQKTLPGQTETLIQFSPYFKRSQGFADKTVLPVIDQKRSRMVSLVQDKVALSAAPVAEPALWLWVSGA
jgi:hypothetical protein